MHELRIQAGLQERVSTQEYVLLVCVVLAKPQACAFAHTHRQATRRLASALLSTTMRRSTCRAAYKEINRDLGQFLRRLLHAGIEPIL